MGSEGWRGGVVPRTVVELTLAIIAINGWNRVAIPFRADVGAHQAGTGDIAASSSPR